MSAMSAMSAMSLESNPALTLSSEANINRRRSERRSMTGSAMATFMDAHGPAALTRVKLLDQSHTGWGVLSDVEVKPGATFWFVPEQGTGMRQTGTVANCTHTDEGWRLGLRKRTLRAVA